MSDPNTPTALVPTAGQALTRAFGGEELAVSGETAVTAAAAQSRAMVEARFVMALRKPRDLDDVRAKLLRACDRPGFAESAWYRKPVGKGVEGLSIRFAEEAIRCLTNILSECPITWDDARKRIVTVTVTDLENNVGFPTDVVIEKTVERSKLREGQTALAVRVNSNGQPTYLVTASEDEIASKQNALVSKAIRTQALRILPGDIQDECKAKIRAALEGAARKDPDAERKKIADAFSALNVMPSHLKAYLGHDLNLSSPAELVDLRALHTAIKSGETTWAEALEARTEGAPIPTAKRAGLDGVADELEKKQAAAAASAGQAPTSEAAAAAAVANKPPQGASGSSCPDHALLTIVNPDGSRACDFEGCAWTAPAPPAREPGEDDVVEEPRAAVQALADKAGPTDKAPAGRRGQRTLQEG